MRKNPLDYLVYNGDWHSRLTANLLLAKKSTSSQKILAAIEELEQQLAKVDECIFTVTAIQEVPPGINAKFLVSCIEECTDTCPDSIQISSTGNVELTITARGSRDHVQYLATRILAYAVTSAKFYISRH